MRIEPSDFFQPFLREKRDRQQQLALEVYTGLLTDQLLELADKEANEKEKEWQVTASLSRAAKMLEHLILRHEPSKTWADFLQKEQDRGRASQKLAAQVLEWWQDISASPVGEAMGNARRSMEQQHEALGLDAEQYSAINQALEVAAFREFLAQFLGRLSQ